MPGKPLVAAFLFMDISYKGIQMENCRRLEVDEIDTFPIGKYRGKPQEAGNFAE